jgi:hypothetical protein
MLWFEQGLEWWRRLESIRDAVGSVPCSDEWKISVVTRLGSHGARGSWYRCWHSYSSSPATRNLSIAVVLRLS